MSIDREQSLRRAEKLLRQGRLDAAIEEYECLVEDQPHDWNTRNALGDLYVRAGQVERAATHFTRIADHFAQEGFFSRAIALYKKVVKIKPDDEHALLQSADVAARQGLIVDAKACLGGIAEQRRRRGDLQGANEIVVRIASLDPSDFTARLNAARAVAAAGDAVEAAVRYKDLATDLFGRDRVREGIEALTEAVRLAPDDTGARDWLVRACLQQGEIDAARAHAGSAAHGGAIADAMLAAGREAEACEMLAAALGAHPADGELRGRLARLLISRADMERAGALLDPEVVGDLADLLLASAEVHLRSGRIDAGREQLAKLTAQGTGQSANVVLLGCSLAATDADAAFACIDAATDVAVAEQDWAAAAAALQEFLRRVPTHIPALMRLVEVSVDGGLDDILEASQANLADCCLATGRAAEARVIAEDLVLRSHGDQDNVRRLRTALEMIGESDPDGALAAILDAARSLAGDDFDLPLAPDVPTVADTGTLPTAAHESFVEEPARTTTVFTCEETEEADAGDTFLSERRDDVPDYADVEAPAEDVEAGAPGDFEVVEIDLSDALTELKQAPGAVPAVAGPSPAQAVNLDDLFRGFREEVQREEATSTAWQHYKLALTYMDIGMLDEAVAALERAARSPGCRFQAALLIGRIRRDQGRTIDAVEWFERAAETPATSVEAARVLLYELGQTLESAKEWSRALAVYLELQADAGSYRDVASRIGRLSQPDMGA